MKKNIPMKSALSFWNIVWNISIGKLFLKIEPQKPALKKRERMDLFINLLNTQKKRFETMGQAYLYLNTCLDIIEKVHAPFTRMEIDSLHNFKCDSKLCIHYFETHQHLLVIGNNGAYAIYLSSQTVKDTPGGWGFYKSQEALVKFNNKYDEDLWL